MPPAHDQAAGSETVPDEHVVVRAFLHGEAAHTVCSTLEQMARRQQEAVRAHPELEPYLRAYFEQSSTLLLESTLGILTDQPLPRPERPPQLTPFRWPMPLERRKEQRDGPA